MSDIRTRQRQNLKRDVSASLAWYNCRDLHPLPTNPLLLFMTDPGGYLSKTTLPWDMWVL